MPRLFLLGLLHWKSFITIFLRQHLRMIRKFQNGAEAMLNIDRQAALELLLQAVKKSSSSNAENVLKVLSRKNISEAVPDLISLFESESTQKKADECIQLIQTLTKLGAYQIEPLLIKMLLSETKNSNKALVKALLEFPKKSRISKALIQAVEEADHTDLNNLNMLRDALIKIGDVQALPALLAAYSGRPQTQAENFWQNLVRRRSRFLRKHLTILIKMSEPTPTTALRI